jgi:regulator of replication initiation timing
MANPTVVNGSGNSRVAMLKKFLAKVPPGSAVLRLYVNAPTGPDMLQEWPAAAVVPALGDDIESLMTEHAGQLNAHETEFCVIFYGGEAETTGKRIYKVRRPQEDLMAMQAGQQFAGTAESVLIQTQRAFEGVMRLHIASQQAMQQMQNDAIDRAAQRESELARENERLRQELEDQRQAARDAEENAGDSEEDADSKETKKRLMGMFEKALPIVLWNMGQKGGGNAPPATGAPS